MTSSKTTVVFDCEIYCNYFLVMFRNVENGKTLAFEKYDGHDLDVDRIKQIMAKYRLISFNGISFDMPIMALALKGANNALIKKASDAIILNNVRYWQFEKMFDVQRLQCDHIDLIEVAPGMASLKIYGGRLHCHRMQDLPIQPDFEILPEQHTELVVYCGNDLQTTIDLYNKLKPQIKLREQMSEEYGIDLRSKSDAQVAEAVIKVQLGKLGIDAKKTTEWDGATFRFKKPAYIEYKTDALNAMLARVLSAKFIVSESGKTLEPEELKETIMIGRGVYRMGLGGLHSSEACSAHYADDETILVDRDVASYYPAIILQGLYPKHLGKPFLKVYRDIVERRLAAKRAGDKVVADSLKITINGSFGKLGSKWSVLYSPDLMIQTTITGQLSLLMLIEALEMAGIPVVSANTDGIVIKCPKALEQEMDYIVFEWECATGFETEATFYKALYSRDVNNYLAIKSDGKNWKAKGAYTPAALQKNPTNEICTEAALAFLRDGTAIEETIASCREIRKFVTIRQVKGGAHKDGVYLGKAVRWYYSTGVKGAIQYKVNDYTVARSEGARPLMTLLDTFPDDVDYAWYEREAHDILKDIGANAA